MHKFTLYLSAIVFAVFAANTFAQQNKIQWNFAKGQSYTVTFDQETDVTSEFNLVKRTVSSQVKLTMDWTVVDLDENSVATIDQIITQIDLNMVAPTASGDKTIQLSTANSAEVKDSTATKMLEQIKPLVNASFTIKMTPAGQVLEVTASKATMEVLRNIPGSMRMRNLITEDGIREIFGQSLIELPKSEFEQGEKWSRQRQVASSLGEIVSSDEFHLSGTEVIDETNCLKITVATKSSIPNQPDDAKAKFVDGSGEGALWFDAEAQYFIASEIRSKISTTQKYRDTAINTDTVSTIRMKMARKK